MPNETYRQMLESTSQIWFKTLSESENLLQGSDAIEPLLRELLREVGQKVCEQLYNQASTQAKQAAKEPYLWVKRKTKVTYYTIFGPVKVTSFYLYNETSGLSKTPARELLGIEGKARSLALDKALTDFGAESSFERATARFHEHYGWEPCSSVLRLVTLDYASQCHDFIEKTLEEAGAEYQKSIAERPGASELLVELDGSEIRTCEVKTLPGQGKSPKRKLPKKKREIAWKEVRVGLCRELEEVGKLCVALKGSYPQIGKQLFEAAVFKGLSSETQVVAVCDGGIGLKEGLHAQFDRLQFILDLPHLKEHLYQTAESLGFDDEEREKWVSKNVNLAFKGETKKLLSELVELDEKKSESTRLKRLIGYITRFEECIDYGHYREKGWPIGSGEVESAHKYVVQQRLKITGASWLEENINPMLALRVCRENGWWNGFWENVEQSRIKQRK